MKEIIVATGVFSRLFLRLNDDVPRKLMLIPKKNNPLAAIEADLQRILKDFEKTYFEAVQAKDSPIPSEVQHG